MELVTPGIGLIFWMSTVFLAVFFLLRKFAWKPILNAVQNRELSIKEALLSAENARKEMQNLKADNERILSETRKERDALLFEAREMKEQIVSQAKTEAAEQANKLIEQAKVAIEGEKQRAIRTLKNQVAELSINIAEKLLESELRDKNEHLKHVETMLNDTNLN